MGILYFLPFLILLIGFFFWYNSRQINIWEWLGSFVVTLLFVCIMHLTYFNVKGHDFEYINSYVTKTHYIPTWESNERHINCNKCGQSTCCRTHHYVETHPEKWIIYTNINSNYTVSKVKYNEINKQLGNKIYNKKGLRQNYRSGDKNDYWVENTTNAIIPITDTHLWINKIKMSKNNYNYVSIPDDINIPDYPKHTDIFKSNKLLGEATKHFDNLYLDKVNAVLGSIKKVNLIIVGFENQESIMGEYIESKWYGGKKNDVVIVYNVNNNLVSWAKVFGWTDSELLKIKIESLLLNQSSSELNFLLNDIKDIILNNYTLKNFDDYNYMTMEVSTFFYVLSFVILLIIIAIYYYIMYNNIYD